MQRPGWGPTEPADPSHPLRPPDPPAKPPWDTVPGRPPDPGRTRLAEGFPLPPGSPGGWGGPPADDRPSAYGQPGAYGPPGWVVPQPRHAPSWPPTRREVVTALSLVVTLAGAGALLAVLWIQLAPRLAFRVVQPGRALPVVPEGEEYVAADGRFVLLTLGAGVLAGLVGWLLRSSRGPLLLAALAVGGLLGAVVTWRSGMLLEPGYRPQDLQEVGRTVFQPLELRALAALVVEPFAAVLVYLLGVGFTARNDLGRDDPVSSGSGSPAARRSAPAAPAVGGPSSSPASAVAAPPAAGRPPYRPPAAPAGPPG